MATITGTSAANSLNGTSSADTIYGLGGADTIKGNAGNDTIYGGDGGDYINGGLGVDDMYGDAGNDVFEIGGGSDGGLRLGFDYFDGGSGTDTIKIIPTSGFVWTAVQIASMTGIEQFQNTSGGPGYIYFENNIDFAPITQLSGITSIFGNEIANTFNGGNLAERVEGAAGNDFLYGNGGDDTLFGDTTSTDPIGNLAATGNDKLYGGAGNDALDGQAGDDYLDGGIGTNTLTGGTGSDQFYFASTSTVNTITDFATGADNIKIATALADDFSDLSIVNDVSGNATVSVGSLVVTLTGVDAATLTSSDFLFG